MLCHHCFGLRGARPCLNCNGTGQIKAAELAKAEPTSLADFYDRLQSHDWTHEYSDDASVYRAGQAAEARLRIEAKLSKNHSDLFTAFKATRLSVA